jgi:hypothetical protein
MRSAPAGTVTDAVGPTATMRLPSTTMVPFSMTAFAGIGWPGRAPAIVMMRAPTSAMVPDGMSRRV